MSNFLHLESVSSFNSISSSGSGFGHWFFIGNNLVLNLLRMSFHAFENNTMVLMNNCPTDFIPLSIFFNLLENLISSSWGSFDNRYPSYIILLKIVKWYSTKS